KGRAGAGPTLEGSSGRPAAALISLIGWPRVSAAVGSRAGACWTWCGTRTSGWRAGRTGPTGDARTGRARRGSPEATSVASVATAAVHPTRFRARCTAADWLGPARAGVFAVSGLHDPSVSRHEIAFRRAR